MPLIFEEEFNGPLQPYWNPAYDKRNRPSNVEVRDDNRLHLSTRQDENGNWFGGSVVLEVPYTFGRFVIRVKLQAAKATKGLGMLWPASKVWPEDGEIDLLEIGGDDAWERQTVACNIHYGSEPKHPIIHKKYEEDMTAFHNVACAWRPTTFAFMCDGEVMPNILWGGGKTLAPNPGLVTPHKLHLTYWPHHNSDDDPWPTVESEMVVDRVRIYS